METKYTTYKFKDGKGRRVAIRGTMLNTHQMEITVITCSKKDKFTKKFARNTLNLCENAGTVVYYGNKMHPDRYLLTNVESPTLVKYPKKTFIEWCNKMYKKDIPYKTLMYKLAYEVEHTFYDIFDGDKEESWSRAEMGRDNIINELRLSGYKIVKI